MAIEVEGPDGALIEFPDGTAPETIKGVLAKRYPTVKSGRTGKNYSFEVPPGADEATILEAAKRALRAQEPETVEQPVMADALGGAARDFATIAANGFGSLIDIASEAGGAISSGFGDLGRFFVTGGGASRDPTTSAIANFIDPPDRAAPTIRGMNERINPGAYDRSNVPFLTEMYGAALMPFGPRRAPVPSALARTTIAPAKSALADAVPGAREVIDAGKREGVRVMTTDVKPPRTFIGKTARGLGDKILFAGTGGPRAAQQAERVDAVKRLLNDFGAAEADDAVGAVSADLIKTRGDEISRLTKAKNAVIDGIGGAVPTPLAAKAIDEQIKRLRGINEDAFKPVIDKLKSFEEVLESGKSLAQIEGNRKLLGDLFADPSLAAIKGDGQKALNAIYGPLRADMGSFIEAKGGAGARARWKAANDRLAAMAGEIDARGFKGLLNNAETTPEVAAKVIFGKTPSDMKRLYGHLSDTGKVKAEAAILYKAAEGATENGVVSPQKFANALEAMDKATGVFFSPANKARIDGLTRLLKATQHASEAAANPVTGAQGVPYAIGAGFTSLFGLQGGITAAGAVGLLARAYESAPVRNRLLRLGRTKPGTKAEAMAMDDLAEVMAKLAPPVAANDAGGRAQQALSQSPATNLAAEEQDQDIRGKPIN